MSDGEYLAYQDLDPGFASDSARFFHAAPQGDASGLPKLGAKVGEKPTMFRAGKQPSRGRSTGTKDAGVRGKKERLRRPRMLRPSGGASSDDGDATAMPSAAFSDDDHRPVLRNIHRQLVKKRRLANYCTCSSFKLQELLEYLSSVGLDPDVFGRGTYDEVIHVCFNTSEFLRT
jgi:hypothetical protein